MKRLKKIVPIGKRRIGGENPLFIIAEAGVNHFGNIEIAKDLVDMAIRARADAVKFQIFKTKNLISSISPDWVKRLKPKELPYKAFEELNNYCRQRGIIFLTTPHDEESLDFLASLNPPAYKIGSGEVSNLAYIRKVAERGKAMILSTGMSDLAEVSAAVKTVIATGNTELILLHCITCYPPMPEEINLRAINTLQKEFGCPVGYSDHSIGTEIILASVAMGAKVIEKHIAISKDSPDSQDCPVSCEEKELIELVNKIRKIEKAIGNGIKIPVKREELSKNWARKSIIARIEIKAGEQINQKMLTVKRPGTGIAPTEIFRVIRHRAKRDIKADSLIKYEDLESIEFSRQ